MLALPGSPSRSASRSAGPARNGKLLLRGTRGPREPSAGSDISPVALPRSSWILASPADSDFFVPARVRGDPLAAGGAPRAPSAQWSTGRASIQPLHGSLTPSSQAARDLGAPAGPQPHSKPWLPPRRSPTEVLRAMNENVKIDYDTAEKVMDLDGYVVFSAAPATPDARAGPRCTSRPSVTRRAPTASSEAAWPSINTPTTARSASRWPRRR